MQHIFKCLCFWNVVTFVSIIFQLYNINVDTSILNHLAIRVNSEESGRGGGILQNTLYLIVDQFYNHHHLFVTVRLEGRGRQLSQLQEQS